MKLSTWFAGVVMCLHGASCDTGVSEVGTSLPSMLQNTASLKQHVVFSQALSILQRLETTPGCSRTAAKDLINDCSSLAPGISSDQVLDSIKTEYAAKLAICEVQQVNGIIPRECSILVPTSKACIKSGFRSYFAHEELPTDKLCYPEYSHTKLKKCLQALEARQQSWTSYTAARQNALIMCQASREAMDRAETVTMYQNLTQVIEHLTSSLGDFTVEQMAQMKTWATDLREFLQTHREQATEDMQRQAEAVNGALNKVESRVSHETMNSIDQLSQLSEAIQAASKLVVEFELQQATHQVARRDQMQSRHEQSLALMQMSGDEFKSMVKSMVEAISSEFTAFHGVVNKTKDEVRNMQQGLTDANRSLTGINQTLAGFDGTTENLRSALETGTDIIHSFTAIYKFFASPQPWLVLFAAMVTFGAWYAHRTIAGYLIAFWGVFGLWWLAGIQAYVYAAKDLAVHVSHILIARLSLSLLITVGVILAFLPLWIIRIKRACFYKYSGAIGKMLLPRIEVPAAPEVVSPDADELEFGVLRSIETPNIRARPYYYRNRNGKPVVLKADVPDNSQHRTRAARYFEEKERTARAVSVC